MEEHKEEPSHDYYRHEQAGYSPLTDGNMMALCMESNGERLFSTGPDDDSSSDQDERRLVSPALLYRAPRTMESDEEDTNDNDTPLESIDYEQLASQALQALELDYQNTIRLNSADTTASAPIGNNYGDEGGTDSTFLNSNDMQYLETNSASFVKDFDAQQSFGNNNFIAIPTHDSEGGVQKNDKSQEYMQNNDNAISLSVRETSATTEEITVNVEQVKAVVHTISSQQQHSTFHQRYQDWEQQQQQQECCVIPKTHALIPSNSLHAFVKSSQRAQQASASLTRSACLADALVRLNLLQSSESDSHLTIHVVGCDGVECSQVQLHFGPFIKWLHDSSNNLHSWKSVSIHLIGPNVGGNGPRPLSPVDLLPKRPGTLHSVTACIHESLYDALWYNNQPAPPHCIMAFHAGIWGYDSWNGTIEFWMHHCTGVPIVITAYTLQECLDDFDVMDEHVQNHRDVQQCCLWSPQLNPWASTLPRTVVTAPEGRVYRENAAWQAWKY
jgi:hypothetical protein